MARALTNLGDYFNLSVQRPVDGRIIDAIYINDGPLVMPIHNYAKYVGTVISSRENSITFGVDAIHIVVQGGVEMLDGRGRLLRPVRPNGDELRQLIAQQHPIYWRYAIPLDVPTTRQQQTPPREAAAETTDEGLKYTAPPTPNTVLEFGGKRTKRRRKKRKSRRKK